LAFRISRFPDHRLTRSRRATPPPSHPSQIGVGLSEVIPESSQPGPVHARFSRGWAEIGVDFSDQALIGVGFIVAESCLRLVLSQLPRTNYQVPLLSSFFCQRPSTAQLFRSGANLQLYHLFAFVSRKKDGRNGGRNGHLWPVIGISFAHLPRAAEPALERLNVNEGVERARAQPYACGTAAPRLCWFRAQRVGGRTAPLGP
jgi:hypothetical protein